MNSTHPNELKETNPSLRVWCKYKVLLDSLIIEVKNAHDKKDMRAMRLFLELYVNDRDKYGCIGCKRGKDICSHYSKRVNIP